MHTSHKRQKEIWEREHKRPSALAHLDSEEVSGGVKKFWEWLCGHTNCVSSKLSGLEICCGKGRNALWLAQQGARMTGFDFSSSAIAACKSRSKARNLSKRAHFLEHDAIAPWPFFLESFDFVIDCFGSGDVDGKENRMFVCHETLRVLKPGGYFFLYTNSRESEFYQKIPAMQDSGAERNVFYYPGIQKFEKAYDENELADLYRNCVLVKEAIMERQSPVQGKVYAWKHFWRIYQKPL